MLSSLSKTKLAERARQRRTAKDTLMSKEVAPNGGVHVQTEQDEHTAFGLVFKRRSEAPIPSKYPHSDARAMTQDVLTIQECEVVRSSKGKSLWDPSLDNPS